MTRALTWPLVALWRGIKWPFAALLRGFKWMLFSSPVGVRVGSWCAAAGTSFLAAVDEVLVKQIVIGLIGLLFFAMRGLIA